MVDRAVKSAEYRTTSIVKPPNATPTWSAARNRLRRAPWAAIVASLALLLPVYASAAPRLHGVVLAVTPKTGEAIVRHDAFGTMPAMTMPFRIVPRARAAQLQPGATIDADVDTRTEPWTLRNVSSSSAQSLTNDAPPRRVTQLRAGDEVPDTPFVDQTGKPFRFSNLRGKNVVLSFIYTRCQDARMCPLISAKFRQLQEQAGARPIHLVEVTLDPAYDRPPVLARYGRTFGADPKRWTLVVGDADPTLNFAAQFGIAVFPDPNGGLIHAENTVLVGPDGRIRKMLGDPGWLPGEILAEIDAENDVASNPLRRVNDWLASAAVAIFGNSVAGFSGLADLAVVLVIFGALAYLAYRLARKIFIQRAPQRLSAVMFLYACRSTIPRGADADS